MEKLVNHYDKEHMRLSMLKHEEVFREQVFELHRLYQVQKILTKNINISGRKNQENSTWNFRKCETKIEGLDLERPAEEESNNNQKNGKMVDESELLELTLGPSKNFYRRREVANAPLSFLQSDNYSGTSLSSSSSSNNNWKHYQEQNMNTSRQDRSLNNNPPWLFQVLSLKMT